MARIPTPAQTATDQFWAADSAAAGGSDEPSGVQAALPIRHESTTTFAILRRPARTISDLSGPSDRVEELLHGNHNLLKYINGVGERAWNVHAVVRSVDLQHMR